jgi:hypothetical protein
VQLRVDVKESTLFHERSDFNERSLIFQPLSTLLELFALCVDSLKYKVDSERGFPIDGRRSRDKRASQG